MNNTKPLQIKTGLRVAKPASEVFKAIVDPEKMSNYFIAKGSGRMKEGESIEWQFPEMEMTLPVQVKKAVPGSLVSFTWSNENNRETLVEIKLNPINENITFVVVTEGEMEPDEQGIQWLKGNTAGWANFLACLKAYLEYGINLRKGAFDPSQMPTQET